MLFVLHRIWIHAMTFTYQHSLNMDKMFYQSKMDAIQQYLGMYNPFYFTVFVVKWYLVRVDIPYNRICTSLDFFFSFFVVLLLDFVSDISLS